MSCVRVRLTHSNDTSLLALNLIFQPPDRASDGLCGALASGVFVLNLRSEMLSRLRHRLIAPARSVPLGVEVAAHLPLLPGLATQLSETSTQIESAVGDICASFQSMVARAQSSVAQAEAIAGGSSDQGTQLLGTLADARTAFDLLLARLASASQRARSGAERVRALEQVAARVESSIGQVDAIAMSVRLLAINAKIEAARDGDRNAGFCVVATEMEHCAGQSTTIAEDVRGMARELSEALRSLADSLRLEADAAAADMAASRAEIENALKAVELAHESIRRQLTNAGDLSRDFAREISSAVVALQFQDRVSQRMAHVIDALRQTHAALSRACPSLGGSRRHRAEKRRADIERQFAGMHTMAEERVVTSRNVTARPLAAAPATGEVELF